MKRLKQAGDFARRKLAQFNMDLNWRVLLLGAILCVVATIAYPYAVLKLGIGVDLSMAGMFIAAAALGRHRAEKNLAVDLNIIQTMIGMSSGIGFVVVVLAAFEYIQGVFGHNVGFNPSTFQMFVWLGLSAILGLFMGIAPRHMILRDHSLPWPGAKPTLTVVKALTDREKGEQTSHRRGLLFINTFAAGFLTFLRDGLGVITPMVGKSALNMMFALDFLAIGLGMFMPLSIGLSSLLGAWCINTFGESVAQLAALSGTSPGNWDQCVATLGNLANITDAEKAAAFSFLTVNCGAAMEYIKAPSHFKYMVQWMMWPATGMMIASALTSVVISTARSLIKRNAAAQEEKSIANEDVPLSWVIVGIAVPTGLLIWLMSDWFGMPWTEVFLAVVFQPILILSGLRVLALTGNGPVSVMTNATQFLFGLIWPSRVNANLSAAYLSASAQSSSEMAVPSFWLAQRIGGKFRTLIVASLIVIPIGAFFTPIMFNVMKSTYGIGLEPGQLVAPTGLKIATLAIVMEQGLTALPRGALMASIIAIILGIFFECLLAVHKRNAEGEVIGSRFGWVPVPAALGFALILPPSLSIGLALGAVISKVWRHFAPPQPDEQGHFDLYMPPFASGLIVGELIVGSLLVPALAMLVSLVK